MLLSLIQIIYVIIHLMIGVYDFSFYRIPNVLLGALLVLYGLYAPFYVGGSGILISLVIFALILALGFGLFALKYIGAGDAKYLAVASLWFGPHGIINFILMIALIGGGLSLIYLFLRDYVAKLSDWAWAHIQKGEVHYSFLQYVWMGSGTGAERGKRENIGSRMIPYGLAIAIGAIIMMKLNPLTL